jgi:perosamine synthetase
VFGVVADERVDLDAEVMMTRLSAAGIGTRPFFYPLHLQPALRTHGFGLADWLPVSERIAQQGFYIPLFSTMSDGDVMRVADALLGALQGVNSRTER